MRKKQIKEPEIIPPLEARLKKKPAVQLSSQTLTHELLQEIEQSFSDPEKWPITDEQRAALLCRLWRKVKCIRETEIKEGLAAQVLQPAEKKPGKSRRGS